MENPMIDNVRIMPKGQIIIPKEILQHLCIDVGDRLTMVCEENRLVLMNPTVFALKEFQNAMEGEAEKAGLTTEEDVIKLCAEVRAEIEGKLASFYAA